MRPRVALLGLGAVTSGSIRIGSHRSPFMAASLQNEDSMRTEAAVRVVATEGKGLGVVATEPIEGGAWVCEYVGVLATDEESDVRYGSRSIAGEGDYMFRVEGDLCLDAQNSTHFSRYLNHAFPGNLDTRVSERERLVEFIATQRIEAGDEYGEQRYDAAAPRFARRRRAKVLREPSCGRCAAASQADLRLRHGVLAHSRRAASLERRARLLGRCVGRARRRGGQAVQPLPTAARHAAAAHAAARGRAAGGARAA
jgi:hypothetical protein